MKLTEDQITTIKSWIESGDDLGKIQNQINESFDINLTYLETRFLLSDLKIELNEEEEPVDETPDEIRYFKKINGSAVGMSTVPEIKAGGRLGMELLTISTLTNYAAGISKTKLSHKEVLSSANQASEL